MFDIQKFEELEKGICDFAEKIHEQVPVHYEGPFITGKLKKPEILFLSFNPGGGSENTVKCGKFEKKQLKYLEEDGRLANALSKIFEKNILENSCETYFKSFFATEDKKKLEELLDDFESRNPKLRKDHDDLMKKLLELVTEQIEPKKIVCIGLDVFDRFCRRSGLTEEKKLFRENGKRLLSFAKKGETPVYGVVHLSGVPLSHLELKELKTFFQQRQSD
jgi:hypothetical protein